jgi:hypothetical protein
MKVHGHKTFGSPMIKVRVRLEHDLLWFDRPYAQAAVLVMTMAA